MNILVINYRDRLHPAAGGAEKHLHRIFSLIAAAGHKVVLFTTSFKGAKAREMVDGIQVIRKGGDLLFQWTVIHSLKKLDREFKFDVVCEDLNKLPVFTPWILKKPLLVQMHHLWRKSIFSEASFPVALGVYLFENAIPRIYKKAPFVVVSPSTKAELAGIGIDAKRISVVYNGSEPVEAPAVVESKEPYFLWLSRVHRYKGIWTALEAFAKFSLAHPEVKLRIAGVGPELKKIPKWLQIHELEDKVELCGYVSKEKKLELMAGSIALLQTSYKEGWGLTVMEAAQLGKTTIASDVPGLKDSVVDGKTGVLFPAGSANVCASTMDKLYSDPRLLKSFGDAAKEYAGTFSWQKAADETMKLLQKAIDDFKS